MSKLIEPYFDNQQPWPCGCFYPDVKIEQEKDCPHPDGGTIRTYNCKIHGRRTFHRPDIDYKKMKRWEKIKLPPTDLASI